MTAVPVEPVRVVMTKWGERPHWEFDALLLGTDEHGTWLATPAGTHHRRPGLAFDSPVDAVTLVPHGSATDTTAATASWMATFNAPGFWAHTYVDLTGPASWRPAPSAADGRRVLTAVDLDLDVVRAADGRVYLDDEDELAEHRAAFGYPDALVAELEELAAALLDAVRSERAPFDGPTASAWLARVGEDGRDALGRASGPA